MQVQVQVQVQAYLNTELSVRMQVQVSFLLERLGPNERRRDAAVGVEWSWDAAMAEGARSYSILVEDVVRLAMDFSIAPPTEIVCLSKNSGRG